MAKDDNKVKAGLARAAALDPERRAEIASEAAAKRWSYPQADFTGELKIGDMVFPCSVLSDGTRILTQTDFMTGMGMYYSGWVAQQQSKNEASADVPHFLAFKSLEPFINKHLGELQSISIKYRTEKGNVAHGIKAEIIPKICDVWLDAEESGKLGHRQKKIAQSAKLLMRSLAHVGIIALVDEATGYQEIRDRKALQIILDKYLTDEWAKWTKTFPDEFYKELFRLKNVSYPVGKGGKKPSYVGHWTNDIVYSRLAPGVTRELKNKNPREPGASSRKRKHHQFMTRDYGHPALTEHLSNITFLMSGCSSWDDFKQRLNRARPKYGDTISMDLD
jgi:hypothetical protein